MLNIAQLAQRFLFEIFITSAGVSFVVAAGVGLGLMSEMAGLGERAGLGSGARLTSSGTIDRESGTPELQDEVSGV
jgi:hypothetical protein